MTPEEILASDKLLRAHQERMKNLVMEKVTIIPEERIETAKNNKIFGLVGICIVIGIAIISVLK